MDNVYVHMGHSNFDSTIFRPISNREHFVKPMGGLWGSPVNSDNSWKDWIQSNDFFIDKYNIGKFYFKLKPGTKLLTINNVTQLNDLPQLEDEFFNGHNKIFIELDFEELAKRYDAIEVLISEDEQLYWDLYGWDVDSVLVMNPNCIEIVDGEV